MTPAVVITLPGVPPSPNQTRREHWHQRSGDANGWKDATCLAAYEATDGHAPRLTAARLEIVYLAGNRRRRDPDNLLASCKPIIDGLVLAGVLADDSFAVVRSILVRMEPADATGIRVEVWAA